MKKDQRILFLGTPQIAAQLLEALITNDFNVVGVVTKVDAPVGRKKVVTPPPVKVIAQKYNIPIFQPVKIKEDFEEIMKVQADLIVCIAYGQFVPTILLNAMPIGSLNFHGSLLPKYRGAAPLQRAIMAGEKISGVTAMEMVQEMDAGVMYGSSIVLIEDDDNFTSYREKFIQDTIEFALEILPLYMNKQIQGVEQDSSLVTFAPPIKKDELHLDIHAKAQDFVNMVRGLSDEPGGYLLHEDKPIKIYKAHIHSNNVISTPGTINQFDKHGIVLQVEDGEVSLDVLQMPGKNKVTSREFVNGNKPFIILK